MVRWEKSMDSMIPSYKPLFELTKRRLYRLKQSAINKSGKYKLKKYSASKSLVSLLF